MANHIEKEGQKKHSLKNGFLFCFLAIFSEFSRKIPYAVLEFNTQNMSACVTPE